MNRFYLSGKQTLIVALLFVATGICFWQTLAAWQHASPVTRTTLKIQPASLERTDEYEIVPQAIQTIEVGQRVWIGDNPFSERDIRFGDDISNPDQWRRMVLRCPKRNGSTAQVEMLRPVPWLEERGVRTGTRVEINVPECGIEGMANVLAIEPCPEIQQGPGRVVTATFRHQAAATIDVAIEGLDEPIGTTANHPFWSESAKEFVRADRLHPGNFVRTIDGLAQVESITLRGPPEPVYNLEVQFEHVYRVGDSGVLVHNGNPCAQPVPDPRKRSGYDPGDIHDDHPVARSLGGDPDVTRPFPAASNLRKGGLEGELRRYEEYLRKNTRLSDDEIRSVIQSEIDGLARDVIASPFGKVFPGGNPPNGL